MRTKSKGEIQDLSWRRNMIDESGAVNHIHTNTTYGIWYLVSHFSPITSKKIGYRTLRWGVMKQMSQKKKLKTRRQRSGFSIRISIYLVGVRRDNNKR